MKKKPHVIKKIIKVAFSFLLVAFIGAVLGHFVWQDMMDTIDVKIFGQPVIVVNINEIHPLENEQQLEDFSLMFGTANGQGAILAAQLGHPDLNKLFGDVLIPVDFGRDSNNLEYSICIINNGDRVARDIRITFSGDTLKTDYERDVDKRIDFVNCGGSGSQSICEIRIKELDYEAPNNRVAMFVKARTPSIADVNISAKGHYESFVNFRRFYTRTIEEGKSIQMFLDGNKVVDLPPLNQNSNFLRYYYSPQENRWIPM